MLEYSALYHKVNDYVTYSPSYQAWFQVKGDIYSFSVNVSYSWSTRCATIYCSQRIIVSPFCRSRFMLHSYYCESWRHINMCPKHWQYMTCDMHSTLTWIQQNIWKWYIYICRLIVMNIFTKHVTAHFICYQHLDLHGPGTQWTFTPWPSRTRNTVHFHTLTFTYQEHSDLSHLDLHRPGTQWPFIPWPSQTRNTVTFTDQEHKWPFTHWPSQTRNTVTFHTVTFTDQEHSDLSHLDLHRPGTQWPFIPWPSQTRNTVTFTDQEHKWPFTHWPSQTRNTVTFHTVTFTDQEHSDLSHLDLHRPGTQWPFIPWPSRTRNTVTFHTLTLTDQEHSYFHTLTLTDQEHSDLSRFDL